MVEFVGEKNLLDLARLKLELEAALGRNVDVCTYDALRPAIRDRILSEPVMVL